MHLGWLIFYKDVQTFLEVLNISWTCHLKALSIYFSPQKELNSSYRYRLLERPFSLQKGPKYEVKSYITHSYWVFKPIWYIKFFFFKNFHFSFCFKKINFFTKTKQSISEYTLHWVKEMHVTTYSPTAYWFSSSGINRNENGKIWKKSILPIPIGFSSQFGI